MQTAPVPFLDLMMNLGILLALLCAVVTQLGFLFKHKGANEAAASTCAIRSDVEMLFWSSGSRSACWSSTSDLVLHVGALAFAPLSVVQAVLSSGVVLLAVWPSACSASRSARGSGRVGMTRRARAARHHAARDPRRALAFSLPA